MARPDPELLDPARYPFACEITSRFADLDLNSHLNNVALAGLIEESRVRFNAATGLMNALDGRGAMVASVCIDYLGQAFYPDPLQGHSAIERVGRTSWTTLHLLRQEGRVVTFARSVLVCVNKGGPVPVPGAVRDSFQNWTLR